MSSSYREPGNNNPLGFLLGEALDGYQRGLMFCLPGHVTAFDPDTQLAQVQCGIQRIVNGEPESIPVISNVPVQFAGDNQWYFYHQITPGETEGLLHFSQRAVDTWINQGGVTAPVDFRMMSPQDAFFAPGYRSRPGAIPGFTNDGCGMSSYDGATAIEMTSGEARITAGGSVLTLNGSGFNVDSSGFTHNGTNVGDTHTHPQGPDSDDDSQQDTGGPQ